MDNDKVQWGSILTNTLSTIVAAVIISAGAVIWRSATTIDSRIDLATQELHNQQEKLEITQDVLSTQIARLTSKVQLMEEELKKKREKEATASNGNLASSPPPAQIAIDRDELDKKNFKEIDKLFQKYNDKDALPMVQDVYQLKR